MREVSGANFECPLPPYKGSAAAAAAAADARADA
jgi:hypothetical protein